MAVPYTFGSATTSIPLSQLDSNFATTITLGNTAIQLGNTVTTLNNMTLASPTLTTPALGTPASGVMTNVTAIPAAQITGSQAIPKSTLPTGSVLQVVNATTLAGITTSSTSFVTTGFSSSITPTSATSKIYAMVNGGGAYCSTSSGIVMYSTIYRNSTNIGDANYGLERHTTVGGTFAIAPHSMSVLDSPATTSSTTYTCYFRNAGTTGTVEFSGGDRGTVSLTLMEIAA